MSLLLKQTEEQKVQQDNIENEKEESKVEAKQPEKNLADEYLNMARIIQADFDNYRKRTAESIKQAKLDGVTQAVEVFIPCLDVFKKAKEMISDDNSRKGIEMLEDQIRSSLKELGVEKIETIGKQFDPNLHHCLMVMEDKTKPDNIVLDEYQAGYRYYESDGNFRGRFRCYAGANGRTDECRHRYGKSFRR